MPKLSDYPSASNTKFYQCPVCLNEETLEAYSSEALETSESTPGSVGSIRKLAYIQDCNCLHCGSIVRIMYDFAYLRVVDFDVVPFEPLDGYAEKHCNPLDEAIGTLEQIIEQDQEQPKPRLFRRADGDFAYIEDLGAIESVEHLPPIILKLVMDRYEAKPDSGPDLESMFLLNRLVTEVKVELPKLCNTLDETVGLAKRCLVENLPVSLQQAISLKVEVDNAIKRLRDQARQLEQAAFTASLRAVVETQHPEWDTYGMRKVNKDGN